MIEATPPIVHLNGTSKQDLLDARYRAIDALEAAGCTLAQAAPNGRDYYPDGPEAVERATAQHHERMKALKSIIDALHEECRAIEDR